jgi:1-phosphofructokinase family hexose kinase
MIATVTLNPCVDYTFFVPGVTLGGTNRATSTRWDYAGKSLNVSKAVARLNFKTRATGFLYSDDYEQAKHTLEAEGIAVDCLVCPGRVRVNAKAFDLSDRRITELNASGVPTTPQFVSQAIQKAEEISEAADVIVVSGSLPPECPPDVYFQIVSRCKTHCQTILDTSGLPLQLGVEAKPTMIKPNRCEIESLVGQKVETIDDAKSAAVAIARRGIEYVLVSLDRDGAVVTEGTTSLLHRRSAGSK